MYVHLFVNMLRYKNVKTKIKNMHSCNFLWYENETTVLLHIYIQYSTNDLHVILNPELFYESTVFLASVCLYSTKYSEPTQKCS